jgi:lipoprotein signal peptidase
MNGTTPQAADTPIGARPRADYSVLVWISGATLILDWATKSWARRHLSGLFDSMNPAGPITIKLEQNRAGAFGLMAGANHTVSRIVFSLVALISVVGVIGLYLRLKPQRSALKWGLPLVLGGALGNLWDRVRFGQVLDFIDVHVLFLGIQRHLSRFNLADVAITLGAGLIAIDGLRRRRRAGDAELGASGSAWPTQPTQ